MMHVERRSYRLQDVQLEVSSFQFPASSFWGWRPSAGIFTGNWEPETGNWVLWHSLGWLTDRRQNWATL